MLNAPRSTAIDRNAISNLLLTGGLNEELSNFELEGGELINCVNYIEKDGSVNGYTSFEGYERYDGQASPSDVAVVTDGTTHLVTSDVLREAARAAILPIPGSGDTLGVHQYAGDVYGFRDNAGATKAEMYKATVAGWSKITSATMEVAGDVKALNSRFSSYNSNNMAMYWVDGVSKLHVYNGSAVAEIYDVGNMPDIANFQIRDIGVWEGRMFAVYEDGYIQFSVIGDPTDWDAVNGAGDYYAPDDITGFSITTNGDLLLAMRNSIVTVSLGVTASPNDFVFKTFSDTSGCIENTMQRMFGTMMFADDRGVTTLEASDAYGDFSASSLVRKVERTYQNIKGTIVESVVNRQDNQYILFYNKGSFAEGLVFSFSGVNPKGATKIKLAHKLLNVSEDKDSNYKDQVYFGGESGYVYHMFTGVSFDGAVIPTLLETAFYHYNTPTRWKTFKEIMFEVTGDAFTSLYYRTSFEYKEVYSPSNPLLNQTTASSAGIWGTSVWGEFIWGGGGITRLKEKITGYGTNMSLLISSNEKYKSPHSLHNLTVQYKVGSTKN